MARSNAAVKPILRGGPIVGPGAVEQAQAQRGHKSGAEFNGYYQVGKVIHNEAGKMLWMAG